MRKEPVLFLTFQLIVAFACFLQGLVHLQYRFLINVYYGEYAHCKLEKQIPFMILWEGLR
jgi:hypothetical protein